MRFVRQARFLSVLRFSRGTLSWEIGAGRRPAKRDKRRVIWERWELEKSLWHPGYATISSQKLCKNLMQSAICDIWAAFLSLNEPFSSLKQTTTGKKAGAWDTSRGQKNPPPPPHPFAPSPHPLAPSHLPLFSFPLRSLVVSPLGSPLTYFEFHRMWHLSKQSNVEFLLVFPFNTAKQPSINLTNFINGFFFMRNDCLSFCSSQKRDLKGSATVPQK